MRRYSLTTKKLILAAIATFVVSLGLATSAQAVILNDSNNTGGATTEAGVSLTPSTRGFNLPNDVATANYFASCTDPWLSTDLGGPTMSTDGLCFRDPNASVIHKNETFSLTWDAPQSSPWAVKNYPSETQG